MLVLRSAAPLIGALLLVLSACGFAPRGGLTGATEIGAIFVDAQRDVPIAAQLKQQIVDRDLKLATSRAAADILLRLTNEIQSQRILSVQSRGRVSEFELRHSVNMLVARGKDGQPARYDPSQRENTVTVLREYTYDEKGVLGKEDEASILRAEMSEELARDLLLRLVATTRGSNIDNDPVQTSEESDQTLQPTTQQTLTKTPISD